MAGLALNLLGPFKGTLHGEPLPKFRTLKVQALLVFLVVESGMGHRREALMELLWPGLPLKLAQVNLRQTLFRLRNMIPNLAAADGGLKTPFLLADRLTIQVNPDVAFELDTDRFDDLIDQVRGHNHLNFVSCLQCQDRLRLAARLYRGPFLADFYLIDSNDFEDWAAARRQAYHRQALDALDTLTAVELQRGAFVEAQACARQQIAIDRLDERAHRRLFEALARDGQRNAALAEYDKLCERLAVDLGVEPSEETRLLHAHLLSGEPLPAVAVEDAGRVHVPDPSRSGYSSPGPPAFLTGQGGERETPDVFVGRERELSQLQGYLNRSLAGRGGMVFVTGEAGQGKTSLLREFARRTQADRPELVVASGVCDALSGVGDAYLPFRDVMAMLTGDVETLWSAGDITRDHALRLWRLMPATARAIVEQAPDLLGTFVATEALTRRIAALSARERSKLKPLQGQLSHLAKAGRQGEDQSQLFWAYTEFLKTVADQHPVLLILDDLQWVDISSVNLLFHLVRRVGEGRILIVGAYRPEDLTRGRGSMEHPLQALIGELRRLSGDIWVELDQKGQAESREFVNALLDREPNRLGERFRREMTHHTQGNPLFTVELLRYMQERGDLARDEMGYWSESPGLGWDTIPAKVEGVIEKRIGRLKPELRNLLAAASVEGEDFTAEVVGSVEGLSRQQVLAYLSQELEKQHRLVRERGTIAVGRRHLARFRFGHVLFQRYLYDALGEGQRRLLNGEIARVLETLYEGQTVEIASHLTYHFLEAGDREKAFAYARQAARRAQAVYAYEEAIQHLQTALDLLETGEGSATRLALLEELADVHGRLANKAQTISCYQAALDLWSSLAGADRMIAVRLHRKILETLLVQWDETLEGRSQTLAASRSYLEARLPLAQNEQPQIEWVRVLIALANIADIGFMSPEDLDTAESRAQAAVELAEQLDAPAELSDALEILGGIQFVRGRLPKRLELSRWALALSQDPRIRDPRKRVWILESHGDALMAVGEYAQAMCHLREMEELAIQSRNVASQVWALSLQALCLLRLDRWEELLKLEEKLCELEQRSARDQLVAGGNCVVLSLGAAVRALQGDLDQARVMREQAYAIMASGSGGSTENWGRTQFY